MARIGIICHPISGRLYPLLAIGNKLKSRGHIVTVLTYKSKQKMVESSGLEIICTDQEGYPKRVVTQQKIIKRLFSALVWRAQRLFIHLLYGISKL